MSQSLWGEAALVMVKHTLAKVNTSYRLATDLIRICVSHTRMHCGG